MRELLGQPRQSVLARHLLQPFQEFVNAKVASGLLLLLCTVIALIWANSPFAASYVHLWETHFSLGFGNAAIDMPLEAWMNDGLMAIFFFLVGLEIKREILVGELSKMRQAILPAAAALGGMVFPALIYTAFNTGKPGIVGWGVPMATDIAFALGVLALLGKRIPLGLKVFLTAFAIVDDLGSVMVIAIFYNSGIDWLALLMALSMVILLLAMNLLGVRWTLVYVLLGILLWFAFLRSGVHATVAGVLLALTIPARARIDGQEFVEQGRKLLDEFEQHDPTQIGLYMNDHQQAAAQALETTSNEIQTPLQRMEHALNPWVGFLIMPLLALANAGVALGGNFLADLFSPVALGIIVGLVLGKQAGVMLFSWLTIKLGWSELPAGVSWRQLYGASCLGGIGFTMSLFVSNLAFGQANPTLLTEAKVGILVAAIIAGACGWIALASAGASARNQDNRPQTSALEAG
jgi:NhaA family Na+:H+ antiporter